MKQVFLIKNKTDSSFQKPFIAICKTEAQAQQKIANLKSRLSTPAKDLVSYEAMDVNDFDMNKSSIYVIYDKTDKNVNKPIVGMHFDFVNAEKQLKSLRSKQPQHLQKLIYAQVEALS